MDTANRHPAKQRNQHSDSKRFTKTAKTSHGLNQFKPMRGGIRL